MKVITFVSSVLLCLGIMIGNCRALSLSHPSSPLDAVAVAPANDDPDRILQRRTYKRPTWWRAYKRVYGRRLLACRPESTRRRLPRTGQRCRRKNRNLNSYVCLFGNDDNACPGDDESSHPTLRCVCPQNKPRNQRRWNCRNVEPECPTPPPPPPTNTCPRNTTPQTGSPCPASLEGQSCNFGTENCCGRTFPELRCSCSGGFYGCFFLDRCQGGCDGN